MKSNYLGALAACGCLLSTSDVSFAASPGPSFDCGKASTSAEQAICKDPKLAAVDAAIARIYELVLGKLPKEAAKALREDQQAFLAARDLAHGRPNEEFEERLRYRLSFLERLATAPAGNNGFEGKWESAYGVITIKPAIGKALTVEAQTADPVAARWVCDTGGEVTPEGAVLSFTDGDTPEEDSATIRLTHDGRLLTVTEELKPDAMRRYCGANGSLEGTYFWISPAGE